MGRFFNMTTIMGFVGGIALVLGLSGTALAQGATDPPPTGPVDDLQTALENLATDHDGLATQAEMTTQHQGLATDHDGLATTAEMTAQHDMIKQDLSAAKADIQADIAEVKALVEALDGNGAPPCGAGTEDHRFVLDDELNPTEVCDNTTGLYWEHSPSRLTFPWSTDPPDDTNTPAKDHCTGLDLGNGQAYRLPEVKELISLVDYGEPNQATALNDPNGPFEDVQSALYWSATAFAGNPFLAWPVLFGNGLVSDTSKGFSNHAWCVRGGQNGS